MNESMLVSYITIVLVMASRIYVSVHAPRGLCVCIQWRVKMTFFWREVMQGGGEIEKQKRTKKSK